MERSKSFSLATIDPWPVAMLPSLMSMDIGKTFELCPKAVDSALETLSGQSRESKRELNTRRYQAYLLGAKTGERASESVKKIDSRDADFVRQVSVLFLLF